MLFASELKGQFGGPCRIQTDDLSLDRGAHWVSLLLARIGCENRDRTYATYVVFRLTAGSLTTQPSRKNKLEQMPRVELGIEAWKALTARADTCSENGFVYRLTAPRLHATDRSVRRTLGGGFRVV